MKFFTEDYCDAPPRQIVRTGIGGKYDAMYCDKAAALLMMDGLPIAVVHTDDEDK